MPDEKVKNKTIRTVCVLRDGLRCGLLAHVTNGIITKVEPADFPNPSDRGACAKGLATPQQVYHPDRLQHPLKRIGQRGEGKWQRVSWDEALEGISAKLREIAQRYGSTSIAMETSIPNLQRTGYSRLASLLRWTWVDHAGFGDTAGPCADTATFGLFMGEPHLSSINDPKFSIVWGYNPAVTDYRRMHRIMETKKKGCKIIAIDPRLTATGSNADEYIQIRPGTDGALALAMIHVVLEQGLQDERFITENTVGPLLVRADNGLFLRESDLLKGGSDKRFMVFDQTSGRVQPCDASGVVSALTGNYFVNGIKCNPAYQLLTDIVKEYTPEKASKITDVSADTIRRLAISYATQKPASIHRGWGVQRSFYADLSCRAINTLAMVTGNINLKQPSDFAMGRLNIGAFSLPGGQYNHIPIMMLADAITKGEPLTIKALLIGGENFVNQMPNNNRIIDGVLPHLELIVVTDLFMTATAKYADYVLPATTFYEATDLHVTAGENTYLQLQQKVIEPLYECKSDFQIAAGLGRKMGVGEYFDKTEEQYIEQILTSEYSTIEGASLERLKKGPLPVKPVDKPSQFTTLTGRIEFYSEKLKPLGQELPIYLEPIESARTEKAKEYPLVLVSGHSRYRLNSSMANVASLLRHDPEPRLEINKVDAEPRNISDGDVISVFNDRGLVKAKAILDQDIKPGVVNIDQGWWPYQYIEGHHNQLTHDKLNPAQQLILEPNAALNDVLVEVKKTDKEG